MHIETKLSGAQVFAGKIINVEHDRVRLEDGREAMREVVRHPGAVAVLAYDGTELLLLTQYRYAVGQELLEIPAGKLEPGEVPQEAALRELREETGYAAQKIVSLGQYYASPGVYDEIIYLYFATELQFVGQQLDDNEFVTVHRFTPEALAGKLADGSIPDGKTGFAFAVAKAQGLL